jgi:hypothetical protein
MNGRVFLLVKRSTASIIVLMIAIVYLFNNYHPSTNIVATSGSIAAGRDVILDWDPRELRRIVDDCNDSIRGLTAERERALTKAEELATNLALRRMLCSLFSES